MKKALITGVAGFVGSYLSQYLLSQKIKVFGFYHPEHSTANLNHLKAKINLIPCNILDKKRVGAEISEIKPDYLFHLAAFSSPSQSFKFPRQTFENNVFGQLNLLEALVKIKSKAKILIIGSSDEYGNVAKKKLPVSEENPLLPLSPYAVSKVAQDMLGLQFYLNYGLAIVRVRPFNHIGPRQSQAFVIPSFATQIVALEKQGGGVMKVGNLRSARDFTDVRDMARAYLLALDKGKSGDVYNIGSGKVVQIGAVLKMMLSLAKADIKIKQDKNLVRPTEIIYCDYTKFRRQTGWRPTVPIETTISDTIEYEKERVSRESGVPRVPRAINQKSS